MNIRRIVVLLSVLTCVAAVPLAKAQTLVDPEDSSTTGSPFQQVRPTRCQI